MRVITGGLVSLWVISGVALNVATAQVTAPSAYVTFFLLDAGGPEGTGLDAGIKTQIEMALADKGLVDSSPEDAEAIIVTHTATREKHSRDAGNMWVEAYDLSSSWSIAGMVPDAVERASKGRGGDGQSDPFASWRGASVPAIYVSTTPAELVVTDGDPEYVPVSGTPLLHIANTTASVFKEPTDHEVYVLTGNGWFRAWTTAGPWQPVAANQLPADLAAVDRRSTGTARGVHTRDGSRPRSTPSFGGRPRAGT